MKKSISILLIFLFAYNSIGYYLTFKLLLIRVRSNVKHEIEHSLSEEQLEVICLTSEEIHKSLRWTEEGKEFEYQNKMYDVVRIKEEKESIKIYCLNDEKEEKLLAGYSDYLRNKTAQNASVKNLIAKGLSGYYIEELKIPDIIIKSDFFIPKHSEIYESLTNEIVSPPPKIS